MKKLQLALASVIVIAMPSWAALQTVTLSVPTMDCPVCPITVKRALTNVEGVSKAEVNFDKRAATVTFDDARASIRKLTEATGNAGYPSSVQK
ncbi:MAG: mercury resistance system periplasmic binding protein MerP [Burkholderiaceae bacterium]